MQQYDSLREYNAACRRREVYEAVMEAGTPWKLESLEMIDIAEKWGVSRTSIYNDLKILSRMPTAPPKPTAEPQFKRPVPPGEVVHSLKVMSGGRPDRSKASKLPTPDELPEQQPITDPFDFSVALEGTEDNTVFSELSHVERLNFLAAMSAHLITSPWSNGSAKGKGLDMLLRITQELRNSSPAGAADRPDTADAARQRIRDLTAKLPPAMRERLSSVG